MQAKCRQALETWTGHYRTQVVVSELRFLYTTRKEKLSRAAVKLLARSTGGSTRPINQSTFH